MVFEMQSIIFVSEINVLSEKVTSTHILTENIIYGLKKGGYNVCFIAICETDDAYANTSKYYTDKVDDLYIIKSKFGNSDNKYKKLFYMFKGMLHLLNYKRLIPQKIKVDNNTVLVSHAPSLEAIFVCNEIMKQYLGLKYIQYWSDPIALSGIMPEQFNLKRKPFYLLEKNAYKKADEIVFGTKTLFEINSKLYPEFKRKMRFVDLAYLHNKKGYSQITENSSKFIYAGNYYSSIRNIKPLYDAFNELGGKYVLNIYGNGDINLTETPNVKIYGRVSPVELTKIESSYKNTISLLNYSCMQIPGKTFYQTGTNKIILVIVDGAHKNELTDSLLQYNRFVICSNNKEDIKAKITDISEIDKYECPKEILDKLSPESVSKSIIEYNCS